MIMKARLVLLAFLFPLLPACTVVRTAMVKSSAAESLGCAADVLNHLGYTILYTDEELGVMRAERAKPTTSRLVARSNADRIVVIATPLRPDQARMITRGETIFVLPAKARPLYIPQAGFRGDMAALPFASAEVRADTKAILATCVNR